MQHRGTNLVPAGPLYFSGTYLGDDPDPNIRFQLLRDISGRFGGEHELLTNFVKMLMAFDFFRPIG